jgi:exopolysaccharide production protein ExoQ
MPPQLALAISFTYIGWLFARDRKLRPMTSGGLWIVLIWVAIIGSRNVSYWFGAGTQVDKVTDYAEGSPFDRNVFLVLIVVGFLILLRRSVNWEGVFASNRWLIAFAIYCGISIIWSDYPFVAFKRWIKEVGNVIMVLIIVTEKNPAHAFNAIFARFIYLVIPLSAVFIKYFPEIGRYYNRWTWEYAYGGVTQSKNELGGILCICGLLLISDIIRVLAVGIKGADRIDWLNRVILMLMVIWLTGMAQSSTSLVCMLLGGGMVFLMRFPWARRQVRHLGGYSLLIGSIFLLMYSVPSIFEAFLDILGRDMTFTGRTALWLDLLEIPNNPLLGKGYASFWLGPGANWIWERYYFHPTQAHNGYLQIYLGLVGVFFLIGLIVSIVRSVKRQIILEIEYGTILLSFLVVSLLYNLTEAMFSGQTVLWMILLVAALSSQRQDAGRSSNVAFP